MSQLLQEYVDSRGVNVSVDREVGILRGVKLIGLESRNGRRYQESALAAAVALYEESKVNVNHPKDGPLAPRDYQDRLGVIRGVELRQGQGLFGDLHFNPKHALAEQLLWDAEHNPHNVGFSHNVLARLSREGETDVVEEITKVQSVDLVADPATTEGLFEQAAEESQGRQTLEALTLEALRLQRPDLLQKHESLEIEHLQEQVRVAEQLAVSLQREQRIYELLCEHRLSVSKEDSSDNETDHRAVSHLFVEWLKNVADEKQLESLIAERAGLISNVEQQAGFAQGCAEPCSRDQTSFLDAQLDRLADPQGFAKALKCSRN